MGQTLLVLSLILLFGALIEAAPFTDEKLERETSIVKAELQVIPDQKSHMNILIRWLAVARVELKDKIEEIGKFRKELDGKGDVGYFVKCRTAIEKFEDDFGLLAEIDYSNIPQPPKISWFERNARIRKQRLLWIFEHCAEEYRVEQLIKMIEKSEDIKNVEEFCKLISVAYEDLSKMIKQLVMIPGTGELVFKYTTTHPKANKAVEVLMNIFEIKDHIVTKKDGVEPVGN